MFPANSNAAAAHWRAGWLSYRQGQYADAARMFDEQIKLYPGDKDTVSAIYWRGRLYETLDHKPANAATNYRTLVRAYQHYFYAQMARRRLASLGDAQPVAQPQLDRHAGAAGAGAAGELSHRQPASGQGAPAGERRTE
jgi:soluble lytic murein transglycosylase